MSQIIGLLIGSLFTFNSVKFLPSSIEKENFNLKTDGVIESWKISLPCYGYDIAIDSKDCVYIIGENHFNYSRVFRLIKYNSSGVQLWSLDLEGLDLSNLQITIDSHDCSYLVSNYQNESDEYQILESIIILMRFNSLGELQWQQKWGGENYETLNDVAIDSENNIYIYGSSEQDVFILKYNSSGDLLWVHIFEETGVINYGGSMIIDSENNIIVSGESSYHEYWLRSYNLSGDLQWSITRKFESFPLLTLDSSDNVISIAWEYVNYHRQLVLVKYDNTGLLVWNYTFESRFTNLLWHPIPTLMKYQFCFTLDSFDNIYIGWDIEIPNDWYNTDILLIKINNSSSFEWFLTCGGSDYDHLGKIGIDSNDDIYLLTVHYLIKNPVNNGKSLYRTNIWDYYLILIGISCFISVASLFFIILPKIHKHSKNEI